MPAHSGIVVGSVVKKRLKTDCRIEAAADVVCERAGTDRCVIDPIEAEVKKRSITGSGIVATIRVVSERARTVGGVVVASGIADECTGTIGGVVRAGAVDGERLKTSSRVVAGAHAGVERGSAYRRIAVPSRVAKQGTKTDGGVVGATAEFQKGRIAFSRIVIRISAVRRWGNGSSACREHQTGEHERDKMEAASQ